MNEPRRVLILTADAGFGHRSAADAISSAINELYGEACIVEIVNPLNDRRTPAFLRDTQTDHDRMVREMPELYKLGYDASDATVPSVVVESALVLMLFEVMWDLIERFAPHVIVTTYPLYQAPLDVVRVISRKKIPFFTIITDLATVHRLWFNESVDACFTPTATVRDLALKYGLPPERVHITGIPVNPAIAHEKRRKQDIRAALGWRLDLTVVLAVGSRRVRSIQEMLRVLNHCGLPLQLVVVSGGDKELYQHFQATQWHVPTHIYAFIYNMPEMMHAADCIMTKAGGLIVTESLACGLPMILVDVNPGQEVGNADYVISGNAGALAESPLEALETVFHWLDGEGRLLAKTAANAHALGKPRAAYDIAEKVWVAAEQGVLPKPPSLLQLYLERSKLIEKLKSSGINLFAKDEV